MLACARIGAVHSVVFGGFAPAELAARIDDAQPKVVISASCGLEAAKVIEYKPLLDAALARTAHQPDYCVIFQRPQVTAELAAPRDIDLAVLDEAGLVRAGRLRRGGRDRPALHPLHLRDHREAQGHRP